MTLRFYLYTKEEKSLIYQQVFLINLKVKCYIYILRDAEIKAETFFPLLCPSMTLHKLGWI